MSGQLRGLRRVMKGALRAIYPPQCLGCADPAFDQGGLCGQCWRNTRFVGACACHTCGAPQPGTDGDQVLCDECLRTVRPWVMATAAVTYEGTARDLVLALKHGDRPDLGPPLGAWLAQALRGRAGAAALVVPVPVHPLRLLRRRYNQAELLSAQVARRLGLDHAPHALGRDRTPPQDHRSLVQRFANVSGAIHVRQPSAVAGRPIVVIDDVMASGATLTAATQALLAAGAGPVQVAVLARAVKV